MGPRKALALMAAFAAGKSRARKKLLGRIEDPALRKMASAWIDRLTLPEEVTAGDYVVAMRRAFLPNAEIHDTACDHAAIKDDPNVVREVVAALRRE